MLDARQARLDRKPGRAFVHRDTGQVAGPDDIEADFRAIRSMQQGRPASFYAATAKLELPASAIDSLFESDVEAKVGELAATGPCRDFNQFP